MLVRPDNKNTVNSASFFIFFIATCRLTMLIWGVKLVFFDDISDADISWYIGQDEYKDKAGAYAIQGIAARFIKGINGCYYNVVGLPINKLTKMLKNVDIGG
jgi:predicted house-cleaning NTP pyrophosphatase (Maf/HAM1 superfamily)